MTNPIHSLSPADIHPAAIEAVFQAAMIPIDDHEPYENNSRSGHFIARELGNPVYVVVDPDSKLVGFRVSLKKPENASQTVAFRLSTLNSLMFALPMLRVVDDEKSVLFEFFLCGDAGLGTREMIASFRRFIRFVEEAIRHLRQVDEMAQVVIGIFGSAQPERPKPPGKDYDVSDIDKLMEELIHGDPPGN